eukprot:562072-Rhodomonas_salina.2
MVAPSLARVFHARPQGAPGSPGCALGSQLPPSLPLEWSKVGPSSLFFPEERWRAVSGDGSGLVDTDAASESWTQQYCVDLNAWVFNCKSTLSTPAEANGTSCYPRARTTQWGPLPLAITGPGGLYD